MSSERPQVAERQRWVRFELAGQWYGVAILEVQEVLAQAAIEPVPGAPADVLGVINLRGSIVTVLDLRRRLGLTPLADAASAALIVARIPGAQALGLAVDRIIDVAAFADTEIQPPPAVAATRSAQCLRGIVSREESLLSLIDLAKLAEERS